VSAALVIILAAQVPSARAALKFEETRADAGAVRTGPVLSHRFAFANRGSVPVEIVEIRASCGCLTPRLARRIYQPGERGELLLEINTLSQAPGPHTWRADVRCRCRDAVEETALLLSGNLITEVKVEPAAMDLFVDRALSEEIVVTDLRVPGLTVTGAAGTAPGLRARAGVRYQDAAGHWACRITVEVADDYPEGRHEENLSVYTDDPLYRELRVPVTVVKHLRQRLSATPAEVSLRAAPGQPIPSRIVLLRDRDNQPVVVDRVQADDPAVQCQWALGPGAMATVKINVDREKVRGDNLKTMVHIAVRQPVSEVLSLPVSCTLP
jgi:hypothetical protein